VNVSIHIERERDRKNLPVGNNRRIYADTDHMAGERASEHLSTIEEGKH